ncbi:MAG: alanine--tRNA ligase [Verrucomicrobiales bacterium]
MTAAQIRTSFLDFFRSKQHTIVPSSSLLPDSPNLLFTNAGMNQFVPIFLGQIECPYSPGRAADTQKCIRAGGKHNDLDDVGLDTYHHTFFEMLGNWSFGDYFKSEAIAWAWELVVDVWKFPPERLYATIYQPNHAQGDPAERDQEAWDLWAEKFRSFGLDPAIHIVDGSKKDNFWMMGDTGPCGPCTEIHVDLRPGPRATSVEEQRLGATLVNGSDARCIEIWNNVFIQYNANPDGSFSPLPACHVDTGMGFERVCSIIQGTRGLTDFENARISNYETDVFRPIFEEIERLTALNRSPKTYTSTLPAPGSTGDTEQERIDVAFRVIADHIRTLSFAIADGILPGNSDRHYVLRRILRRAVRYGRTLGFTDPFFYRLVDVVARQFGDVFPELRSRLETIKTALKTEEEAFNRTLDHGIRVFEDIMDSMARLTSRADLYLNTVSSQVNRNPVSPNEYTQDFMRTGPVGDLANRYGFDAYQTELAKSLNEAHFSQDFCQETAGKIQSLLAVINKRMAGGSAFLLSDTFGFPIDLTELMARERNFTVDLPEYHRLLDVQRATAQAAQKRQVISLSEIETKEATVFVGYEHLAADAKVLEVVSIHERTAVVLDVSAAYAEMGGQLGDSGEIVAGDGIYHFTSTQKVGNTFLHLLRDEEAPAAGSQVRLVVDRSRRRAIERHHTATHVFHWALHEVVSKEATQKGSSVGPEKLTFDFNSAALTSAQLADIEKLVNERIVANETVSWTEVSFAEAKAHPGIMQLFGEKYGDRVRVVQIGGGPGALDGWSMELCGGTHTRHTGEIGLFRLVGEGAVAAGVRRVEAVAGLEAVGASRADSELLKRLAGKLMAQGPADLEKKLEALLDHQKALEKSLKAAHQREAAARAKFLLSTVEAGFLIADLGEVDGDFAMAVADALKPVFQGVVVLGTSGGGTVSLIATVSKELQARIQAGKIIQSIAPIVGGKGGGKPDFARGGGRETAHLGRALAEAKSFVTAAL